MLIYKNPDILTTHNNLCCGTFKSFFAHWFRYYLFSNRKLSTKTPLETTRALMSFLVKRTFLKFSLALYLLHLTIMHVFIRNTGFSTVYAKTPIRFKNHQIKS